MLPQRATSQPTVWRLGGLVVSLIAAGCISVAPGAPPPTFDPSLGLASLDATAPQSEAPSVAPPTPERTRRPCQPGDTRRRCRTAEPATPTPTDTPTAGPTDTPAPTDTLSPSAAVTAAPTGSTGGVDTDIAISTLAIDFGQVNPGSIAQASVTLTNIGGDPFTVHMAGGAPPNVEFNASQNCVQQTLPSGGSCMVNYSFSPTTAGIFVDFSSFIVGETDDQSLGEQFTVALYGCGIPC